MHYASRYISLASAVWVADDGPQNNAYSPYDTENK